MVTFVCLCIIFRFDIMLCSNQRFTSVYKYTTLLNLVLCAVVKQVFLCDAFCSGLCGYACTLKKMFGLTFYLMTSITVDMSFIYRMIVLYVLVIYLLYFVTNCTAVKMHHSDL